MVKNMMVIFLLTLELKLVVFKEMIFMLFSPKYRHLPIYTFCLGIETHAAGSYK